MYAMPSFLDTFRQAVKATTTKINIFCIHFLNAKKTDEKKVKIADEEEDIEKEHLGICSCCAIKDKENKSETNWAAFYIQIDYERQQQK